LALCTVGGKELIPSFAPSPGAEQFFDLQNGPHELRDLAAEPDFTALVKEWRQRMIKFLSARGDTWVRDGDLVVQPKALLRRPNAPNVVR
jgi:hypothetical protein